MLAIFVSHTNKACYLFDNTYTSLREGCGEHEKLDDLKVLVGDLVPPYIRRTYWDSILEMTAEPNEGCNPHVVEAETDGQELMKMCLKETSSTTMTEIIII
ncbi:hypothetical protein E2C01_102019 [Portunus trituberculatus]|uniref:Uncharacterized protein n=1 Tax=Portunus trituberculatus TaxID=210409 RepID=A0A5B7K717_PORTR|nr:hypothetical protein [Portunus trituberculatus]